MKVGDLVQYKDYPQDGHGIVLEIDAGYILMWFADADDSDHVWETQRKLEVICK